MSKSRTRFVHTPSLARPRTCGEQVAHPVCAHAQPRTHAVKFGCAPAPGSCWPKPAGTRACGTCGGQVAPAVSKSRSRFVHTPSLARTRFIPSTHPRRAPVGRSPQELAPAWPTGPRLRYYGSLGILYHSNCALHKGFLPFLTKGERTQKRRPFGGGAAVSRFCCNRDTPRPCTAGPRTESRKPCKRPPC